MTRTEFADKMELIIKVHTIKCQRLERSYNRRYENAMTACEILALNEWFDKEQEKLETWYGRKLRELSEAGYENE